MDMDVDRQLIEILGSEPAASGVNFSVGRPPQVEVDGTLRSVGIAESAEALTPQETQRIARTLMRGKSDLLQRLEVDGSCDCAYVLGNGTRLRVNVFKVDENEGIVIRIVSDEIPTFEQLGLPAVISEIPELTSGLVLITGATGSGKSTTLAAIIDQINRTRPVHIVTLEDPVEFRHKHRKSTVNQRQLGTDFRTFRDGLRATLRQTPQVIAVGEMRDRETIEIAVKAAETGHLVLSTLHTMDTGRTINRITGMFDSSDARLVQMRLAETLSHVVGQRLLPRADNKGRVAAIEVMTSNLRIRELIQNGESGENTFEKVLHECGGYGMQTFDQHILKLFEKNIITEETARGYSTEITSVTQAIDRMRIARGEDTSDLGELELANRVERKTNPYKTRGGWNS
jgi:twitching motility protein PilT